MQSIRILFQVSDEEIASNAQRSLFDGLANFDSGLAKSYAFIAVELTDASYARGRYAELAREINKRFPMPVFVLFRTTGGHLTLAFVQRRQHRRNSNRSVLGGVTLIREIDPEKPHRAHLDVLCELALSDRLAWMQRHGKPINFDGLLDALLFTLDTQELNKRFYRELFDWFNWAVSEARFPTGQKRTLPSEEHVIRLITRLLFIWFIKEKGLVDEDLFNETRVKELLKGYERDTGDSYYRAVLQNLFFATLNCEICKREWSSVRRQSHRIFSRYRFHREVQYPDKLFALFRQTPFINGGLFDCLDSVQSNSNSGWRIDCFTDNVTREGTRDYGLVSVPNRLFFEEHVDRRGIFTILNRYKFTVEENTPNEVEVALDPELLGMVFENLLAAYNPETKKTARKQTGSYYTPRQVVEYMVNEALIASLSAKVQPSDGDEEFWQERLRYLFDDADAYEDANELFEGEEAQALIHAIAQIKILDPACGSGAFPMGVLHKLTLALRRIDPENLRWEALQKEKARKRASSAFDAADQQARNSQLREISDTFERYRDSDFGRKLYLIQNSIFGVDIQPVACQIAKLRFFISLAIEQNVDSTKANLGIRPLPNLETRFVAADALLPLRSAGTGKMTSVQAERFQQELRRNRELYFHAQTRDQKLGALTNDREIRENLANELASSGWPSKDAKNIADWDPFDQGARAADWFDARYMFNVSKGFDITIGNPPYVRADFQGAAHKKIRKLIAQSNAYDTLWEKWDLFLAFMERSLKLVAPGGVSSLIVSDAFCHAKYALKARNWYLKNVLVERIDFYSGIKIFDATVRNVSYVFRRAEGALNTPSRRVHTGEFGRINTLQTSIQGKLTERCFFAEDYSYHPPQVDTVKLSEIFYISVGMAVHSHERYTRNKFVSSDVISGERMSELARPFLQSKHLRRWATDTHRWLEWGTERAPSMFRSPTFQEMYEVPEKLLSIDMSAGKNRPCVTYDKKQRYHHHAVWAFVPWRHLKEVRNLSIRKQALYQGESAVSERPDREVLEKTSERFLIKFLLGVMNSSFTQMYLHAHRRNNLHIYPNDWKPLPIPDISKENQMSVVGLVDQILAVKDADPDADVSALEAEIDRSVHGLYGLTEAEITVVEGR